MLKCVVDNMLELVWEFGEDCPYFDSALGGHFGAHRPVGSLHGRPIYPGSPHTDWGDYCSAAFGTLWSDRSDSSRGVSLVGRKPDGST